MSRIENVQAAIAAAALPKGFVCTIQDQGWGQYAVIITREGAPQTRWSVNMALPGDVEEIPGNAKLIRERFEQWMHAEKAPAPAGGWWQD